MTVLRTGYSFGDKASVIPMKVVQWHMKPKKFHFHEVMDVLHSASKDIKKTK